MNRGRWTRWQPAEPVGHAARVDARLVSSAGHGRQGPPASAPSRIAACARQHRHPPPRIARMPARAPRHYRECRLRRAAPSGAENRIGRSGTIPVPWLIPRTRCGPTRLRCRTPHGACSASSATPLAALLPRIDAGFAEGCRLLIGCRGRVVVTGMGKSGHIGGKIAATLASTGTPAFFVHPGEASHGRPRHDHPATNAVIAISNSGETAEVLTILPLIKRNGGAAGGDDRPTRLDSGQVRRRSSGCFRRAGSLPAESGTDRIDHRHPGDGRCAGGGAARGARLHAGGLRMRSHPGGALGQAPAAEDVGT